MLGYEWKKMLVYRRGFLLVLLLLAARFAVLWIGQTPYTASFEANREAYDGYLEYLLGELTEEKKEFIEEEYRKVLAASGDLDDVRSAYFAGTISREEYEAQTAVLQDRIHAKNVVFSLYVQYIYVREDTAQRYFVATNGWNALLSDTEMDLLTPLALILMLVSVFCEESRCDMDALHLTSRRSARHLISCKVTAAVVAALAVGAMSEVVKLLFCLCRYGLDGGNYTLQSLQTFSGARKALTLWQAYGLSAALRLVGCVYGAMLILLLSSFIRQYALSVFASMVVLYIPYLVITQAQLLAYVPGPWGYLIGTVYLLGEEQTVSAYTGEVLSTLPEVGWGWLAAQLLLTAGIFALIVFVLKRTHRNQWEG